jgi:hypothetical protein
MIFGLFLQKRCNKTTVLTVKSNKEIFGRSEKRCKMSRTWLLFKKTGLALLVLIALNLFIPTQFVPIASAQSAPRGWRDTGLTLPENATNYNFCFDGTLPGSVIVFPYTYIEQKWFNNRVYNWLTGQNKILDFFGPPYCSEETGVLFGRSNDEKNYRYTQENPKGEVARYFPSRYAQDGSLYFYRDEILNSIGGRDHWKGEHLLLLSKDAGLNWQTLLDKHTTFAVYPGDARVLYKLVYKGDNPNNSIGSVYSLYYSGNAGESWEKRSEVVGYSNYVALKNLAGRTNSANALMFVERFEGSKTSGERVNFSRDGGRTFKTIDIYTSHGGIAGRPPLAKTADFFQTSEGLIRLLNYSEDKTHTLELSLDGAYTWRLLTLPYKTEFDKAIGKGLLRQAYNAPDNLFYSDRDGKGDLWHSPDGGRNWQNIAENMEQIYIAPYAPLTLIGVKNKKLYALTLPSADKSITKGVVPNGVADGLYFPETRHNLSNFFRQYWEQKGGLAQFGYPLTEAFREVNPSDGKGYIVQYFERARFEYHPENAGTPNQVLLGLLGNQLTQQRRDKGEPPFKPVANPNQPNVTYFEPTGHTLRGVFKDYWEKNGGLALYGYPLSEEFEEINPNDGKTYRVQYFERNRFEYHPENAGTRYEVLLGLLGNTLLKQKGWL